MDLIKTCKIHCISETLSPLTHMMKTAGNESLINREKVYCNGDIYNIPVLSGNAIRHKMIREPGALYIIKACGLEGKLKLDQANYLLNGGCLSESSTTDNLRKIAEMQELLPLIRLLGGSLKNQVVGGSLIVLRGILICEENKETINKFLPEDYKIENSPLKSFEEFVSQYNYTRGDAIKRNDASILIKEQEKGSGKSNLMVYNGQTVIPGALWYHGFILQNISPLEVGALLHSLQQWEKNNSVIGGYSRIGHGKIKTEIFFEDGTDFFGSDLDYYKIISDYIEHIDKNKKQIINWLNISF